MAHLTHSQSFFLSDPQFSDRIHRGFFYQLQNLSYFYRQIFKQKIVAKNTFLNEMRHQGSLTPKGKG